MRLESRPPLRHPPSGASAWSSRRTALERSPNNSSALASEVASGRGSKGTSQYSRTVRPSGVTVRWWPGGSEWTPSKNVLGPSVIPQKRYSPRPSRLSEGRSPGTARSALISDAKLKVRPSHAVEQRLDAEPVPRDEQALSWRVPDRKGEHALQPLDASDPVALVHVEDDLGVGLRLEADALPGQLVAEGAVVVDLAVEDDPRRAAGVRDGLVTALGVDDGEAAAGEAHDVGVIDAVVVGPSVRLCGVHGTQHGRVHPLRTVDLEEAGDAAHRRWAQERLAHEPREPPASGGGARGGPRRSPSGAGRA